jgi:hypothetical protein
MANALVTDNTLDNSYYGISMWDAHTTESIDGNALRMPLSYLSAQRNRNGSQLVGITPWGNNSTLPVIGTQQKGDFYMAGSPTLLWRNTNTGKNVWWPMTNTNTINTCGPVVSNWLPPMPTTWAVAGTADFTGDCNNDILWTMPGTTNLLLWTMMGPSFITSNWMPALPGTGYGIAATGDFNGDGKTDLVLTNSTANQFIIWLMNGTNFLMSGTTVMTNVVTNTWPSPSSRIVAAGPFNGGEQADILFRDSAGYNYVWNMAGTNFDGGSTNQVQLSATNTSWQVVGVGDFNGDGIADIVWRNPTNGANSIWLTSSPLSTTYINVSVTSLAGTNWTIGGPR